MAPPRGPWIRLGPRLAIHEPGGGREGAVPIYGDSRCRASFLPVCALSSPAVPIRVVRAPVPLEEIRQMAREQFGDFVKAVVDVGRGVMAVGGELHADEEALLLEAGARQADLWGITIYPGSPPAERIEYDSLINVRPSLGNRSRSVEDPALRQRIGKVVTALLEP
jgi:hypothetical protein